jgi:diketogulonate reductase-like aldo/keto reductase
VQNRCYASTGWDGHTRAVCRTRGIGYQGFSLLTANRQLLQRPIVDEIMARSGMTREQVVFRFALQVGMIPLTGTSSAQHMREDLAAVAMQLSDADVHAIEMIATS